MAEDAAKGWLIENLCASIFQEAKLFRDVHEEARNLKDDMEGMRSFLRAADRMNDSDDTRKRSLKRLRKAVYDAEDVLDRYMLCFEENNEDSGLLGFVRKKSRSIMRLNYRYQIASEIRQIRTQTSEVAERRRDYELSGMEQQDLGRSSPSNNQAYDPRLLALFFAESDLVGIDEPRDALIELLQLGGEASLLTISVVGMGGLGKTTLAKTVYEQSKGSFETYACIPVSQTFRGQDIFRVMIAEFRKAMTDQDPLETKTEADAMTEVELIQALRKYLVKKSFLLVLDDVWTVDAWKSLKTALPDQQQRVSRVILTTRQRDVAQFCCARPSDRIYDLQPLDGEKAWSLFCRRAFRTNEENSCPCCLQDLARSFVNKCRGLPLALIALGSLLSVKRQAYHDWEMIHRSLGSELVTDDHLKTMTNILLLSFNDLPYYLRSCFLYLSNFPEDHPIKRMKLIRLWVAEGLIESKEGMSLEEVADGYLNQLIRRSLVQVAEWKHDETVKTCQLHDIVRDIIISKYKEEDFFASSSSVQQDTLQLSDRIRHLSIYNKVDAIGRYDKFTHLRSMLIFGVDGVISSFAGFRCLRVVDLENVPMESFPDDLTQLLLLRYLSLENTKITNLPNSVEKLRRLETLNLKGTSVCELPAGILKLQRLRHLLVYRYGHYFSLNPFTCISGVKVPAAIGRLRSLQKVGLIAAETGVAIELGNLTELRRLCVSKLRRADGNDFCASVAKMSHLQALDVISIRENEALELQSLLRPPPTLQRVYLSGRLENLPEWIPSLHTLVSLRLCWSRLRDDPLKPLQSLTNLVELEIIEAYDGEDVRFEGAGYPKLKSLYLEMRRLKRVMVENGAMPRLEILTVSHCEKLMEAALWLQQLPNMKELCVRRMPEEFVRSLYKGEVGEEWADCVRQIQSVKVE